MFKNIFSFKGRIRRLEYGLTYLAYLIISNLLQIALDYYFPYENTAIIYLIILIPIIWIVLAQGAKRCHDRGNSGWYQIIPFYIFWMLFADGDPGPNTYGGNPKHIGYGHEIDDIGKTTDDGPQTTNNQ